MKILWFTWKDLKNPFAGGAEVVNEQLAKRLAADGHEVIFLVRSFSGATPEESVDGYKIIRLGNHHSVYWKTYQYYRKHLRGWADVVIEEVNTMPFFCNWYVHPVQSSKSGAKQFNRGKEKNILFFHQLCREIWFYEMNFYKGLVGYLLESVYLRLLGKREVITVSESTKKNLGRFGFRKQNIGIISEGIEIAPVVDLAVIEKFEKPTLLSLGALRAMKRTDQIVRAFELAKKSLPELQLIIAGCTKGAFGIRLKKLVEDSPWRDSIQLLGKVSPEKKIELLQKAHLLCAASVKEGWGLVVTEANSQGTPAVVYDADGFRDSVRHDETGVVCGKNTPGCMAENVVKLLKDKERYERFRKAGWQWSKQITFERSYEDFKKIIMGGVHPVK
jgi:glycosyltransferase involved in cell wall biosynthesis